MGRDFSLLSLPGAQTQTIFSSSCILCAQDVTSIGATILYFVSTIMKVSACESVGFFTYLPVTVAFILLHLLLSSKRQVRTSSGDMTE